MHNEMQNVKSKKSAYMIFLTIITHEWNLFL